MNHFHRRFPRSRHIVVALSTYPAFIGAIAFIAYVIWTTRP